MHSKLKVATCLIAILAFLFCPASSYAVFNESPDEQTAPPSEFYTGLAPNPSPPPEGNPSAISRREEDGSVVGFSDLPPSGSEEDEEPHYAPGTVLIKLKPSSFAPSTSGVNAQASQAQLSETNFGPTAPKLNQLLGSRPALANAKIQPVFKGKSAERPSESFRVQSVSKVAQENTDDHGLDRWKKVEFDANEDVLQLCAEIMATGEAEHCQPDFIMEAAVLPNDTYVDGNQDGNWDTGAWGQTFENMWGLKMVQAVDAWDAPGCTNNCRGENVIIAVVDSGLDYNHPDIQGNIFVNTQEDINNNGELDPTPSSEGGDFDGIDNDGNGFVDDVSGYDFTTCATVNPQGFCTQTKPRDPDPLDGHGHGTHVSGTAAAVANNATGIAGAAPKTKVLPVKSLNDQGSGSSSDLAAGLTYAADMGANVINNSWGCPSPCPSDPVVEDAVTYAYGQGAVIVFAAGNENLDVSNFSPQNMDVEVITVAAVNHLGQRPIFPDSNFGELVDIAAPGELSILSLRASGTNLGPIVGTYYMLLAGTSMAAPHVSAVAAILVGNDPQLIQADVVSRITASATPFDPLPSDLIGAGIVNAYEALAGTPNANVISHEVSGYLFRQEGRGISLRLSFMNFQAPFSGTLSTTHPDIQITQAQATFVKEAPYNFANNTASQFRVLYTGSEPIFFGDINFNLHIASVNLDLPTTITLGIRNQAGWPVQVGASFGSPAVGDLDGDGMLEIVNGSSNIYAWHFDGTVVDGWPVSTGGTRSSPAIADLDGYGSPEVVIGSDDAKVYAWHANGSAVSGWPQQTGDRIFSSPAIADLDGNGSLEVVIGSDDDKVYAWHADGTIVNRWPQQTGGNVRSSPSIANLDGTGTPEIIVGSFDGHIYAWHTDGSAVAGWPPSDLVIALGSPAIADLNGDGGLDVMDVTQGGKVYAWNANGTSLSGWPQQAGGAIIGSGPVIADLDGNGTLEVIVGSHDDKVHVWRADGTTFGGWPQMTGGNIESSPAVADLDGDGMLEVLVGSDDKKVHAWHADGTIVPGWPVQTGQTVRASPAIADLDRNGIFEVIVSSDKVYVWTLPYTVNREPPWPMFRHDLRHTAFYTQPQALPILSISVTPTTGWSIGNVVEGQLTSPSNLFTVTNNGNVAETFTLSISGSSSPSGWLAGTSPGNDTFAMKGLFGPTSGNPAGLFSMDDAMLIGSPSLASSTQFGDPTLTPNGANVDAASERGLWFQFQAPTTTQYGGTQQSIAVVVGAEQA